MVDQGRSPTRTASPPSSQRGGEADLRKSGRKRVSDTSEFTRAELNDLLAQEAHDEEDELGSSTVRLEADQLDVLLEKARQKLPPPRAQQATQPYDQVTASVLLDEDEDEDDATPTTPAAEPALEDEPDIDVDEGEPIESVPAIAPPAPASTVITPEESSPTPPVRSATLPLAVAAEAPRAILFTADLGGPDDALTRSRKLRARILVALAGALALAALVYFALIDVAPAPSPTPPGKPASGETRPAGPAR